VTRDKKNPDERLEFEMLLSELSTAFINAPNTAIDHEIELAQQRLVEFLGFDRSTIFQRFGSDWRLTHSWATHDYQPMEAYTPIKEIPWVAKQISRTKDIFQFSRIEDLPPDAEREKAFFRKHGPLSMVAVPMIAGGKMIGLVSFGSLGAERSLPTALVERTRLVGIIFANALVRKETEASLQKALMEVSHLKDQLTAECGYLRDEIELNYHHQEIVGHSASLLKALSHVERVAVTSSTVLLTGETGTGKELLARAIHNLSSRKKRAMLKVNCAALPPTLIENELFGREKGAYTGAVTKRLGRFEVADGSTVFLDEISELPLELQAKLLRVLQESQFERIGSSQTITVDVRIIAATNRDLAMAVQEGLFREDLYYRLNVFPIRVPPLRERREDIPLLVWAFVRHYEQAMGKEIKRIPQDNMAALQTYPWPGNVRELRNVVERAMILCQGASLHFDIPQDEADLSRAFRPLPLHELEKRHVQEVLKMTSGRVRGPGGAAEILGLKPTTLDARIKKLGVSRRP